MLIPDDSVSSGDEEDSMVDVRDRVFGTIAASQIGSAMGAPVEGMHMTEIEQEYGRVEGLMPYAHYDKRWQRPAGTTEDGIERQRMMATAIIEKGDRIDAEDLARIWRRDINPAHFYVIMEPCDEPLWERAMQGIPAEEIGKGTPFPGVNSFPRSSHCVGIMNAQNPDQAAADALSIGSIYQEPGGESLHWAAGYCAGIAAAMLDGATVDSVLAAVRSHMPDYIQEKFDTAQEMASKYDDVFAMREDFYEVWNRTTGTYPMSMADEVVNKGFAVFRVAGGDPNACIIGSVNFGRDTDCLAAISGGLAGALNGSGSIPEEWIATVDAATKANPYTVSQRTLCETADGLYGVVQRLLA
jgi:ADP-ribosylglycohydrolase